MGWRCARSDDDEPNVIWADSYIPFEECTGATVFPKEVTKKAEYRFTVKTSERELKLRAGTKEEYDAWQAALKPVVDAFGLLSTEDDD